MDARKAFFRINEQDDAPGRPVARASKAAPVPRLKAGRPKENESYKEF
jgi:hypothetical protein